MDLKSGADEIRHKYPGSTRAVNDTLNEKVFLQKEYEYQKELFHLKLFPELYFPQKKVIQHLIYGIDNPQNNICVQCYMLFYSSFYYCNIYAHRKKKFLFSLN